MPVSAELVEQVITVPVTTGWPAAAGPRLPRVVPMQVTAVFDNARPQRPFVVLLHGRPTTTDGFARMGIQSYPANARWLVTQGFAVLIPTRIGYGQTGGPDLEFAGSCASKDYRAPLTAQRDEVRQLLQFAARLPAFNVRRGLVLGESFGALGALALADGTQPGVLGVVNVAGGDGGSFASPDQPCAVAAVTRLFGSLGAQARLPSLWLYSGNDHLWGRSLPRQWFDAYQRGGSPAEFVLLEDVPGNGHFVFDRRPLAWHGPFLAFASRLGLLARRLP